MDDAYGSRTAAGAVDDWIRDVVAGQCKRALTVTFSEFHNNFAFCRRIVQEHYKRHYRRVIRNDGTYFVCNRIVGVDVAPDKFISIDGKFTPASVNLTLQAPSEFIVYMFGSLMTGEACTIRVRGFKPYFDVLIPPGTEDEFRQLASKYAVNIEPITGWLAEGFQFEPSNFMRVASHSLKALSSFHYKLNNHYGKFVTYNNNTSPTQATDLFNRVHSIQVGKWLRVYNPTRYDFSGLYQRSQQSIVHYEVGVDGVKSTDIDLQMDPTLVMSWDIETYSPVRGDVPSYERKTDYINLACYNLSWHFAGTGGANNNPDAAGIIMSIAATSVHPSSYDFEGPTLIVKCANDDEIGCVHAMLFQRFQPSFVFDFNGFGYDWPWMFYTWSRFNVQSKDGRGSKPREYTAISIMCYSECGRLGLSTSRKDLEDKFKSVKAVKISAGNMLDARYVVTDGFTCVDTRIVMMRKYPDEVSQSLNFFSAKVLQIGKKDDLSTNSPDPAIRDSGDSYGELYRINTEYIKSGGVRNERIAEYIHYCIMDAQLCHLLQKSVGLIAENRSICNDTYLSLHTAIMQAGSSKVINTVLYHSQHTYKALTGHELIFRTVRRRDAEETEKYEGAYVVNPELDILRDSAVAGLDIESLYPNIINNYNLCPSKIIAYERPDGSPDFQRRLATIERLGWEHVREIRFEYGGRQYIHWAVRHHGDAAKMGIFPTILSSLFNKRVILKRGAAVMSNFSKEFLVGMRTSSALAAFVKKWRGEISNGKINKAIVERITEFLDQIESPGANLDHILASVQFIAELLDKDQYSKKVLMNTFYGVAGSSLFFLYNLYIAASVTSLGRQTIKRMQAFAVDRGFRVRYGDTDSMYIYRPASYYQDLRDKLMLAVNEAQHDERATDANAFYELVRPLYREYYAAMITSAIGEAKALVNEINAEQVEFDGGHTHIRIAYEEVLCPCAFFIKKHYAGLVHKDRPNLDIRLDEVANSQISEFVLCKGIEVIKKGSSDVMRDFGFNVLRRLMDPLSNDTIANKPMYAVVVECIIDIYSNYNWQDYEKFTKTYTYKERVHNIMVQEYVQRLKKDGVKDIPKNGEKFKVVRILRHDLPERDMFGRAIEIRTSQRLASPALIRERGYEIDRVYYMSRLESMITEFIAYMFVDRCPVDRDADDWWDQMKRIVGKQITVIYDTYCRFERKSLASEDKNYFRQLTNHPDVVIQAIMKSFYTEYQHGHFYDRNHMSIASLVRRETPDTIASLLVCRYSDTSMAAQPRDQADIIADLKDLWQAARDAYCHVEQMVFQNRRSNIPPSQIKFDPVHVETIVKCLDLIEDLRISNKKSINYAATKSILLLQK